MEAFDKYLDCCRLENVAVFNRKTAECALLEALYKKIKGKFRSNKVELSAMKNVISWNIKNESDFSKFFPSSNVVMMTIENCKLTVTWPCCRGPFTFTDPDAAVDKFIELCQAAKSNDEDNRKRRSASLKQKQQKKKDDKSLSALKRENARLRAQLEKKKELCHE